MKTRQSTAKKWTLIVLVAFALIALISGTYARYSTSKTVNATTQVAKWQVALKKDDAVLTDNQNIAFTVQNNTNVVPGKIAPAVTATATIDLDLTGTEVAVDFGATIAENALSSIGASGDKLSLTATIGSDTVDVTSGEMILIPLVNNAAFTSENGAKTVTLTLTWENDDENNENDTTMGEAAAPITIPVTLTAQQHIGA